MRILSMLLLCLVVGTPTQGQGVTPEEAVRQTITGFFDALREKDEAGLRNAVAPDARIMGIRTVEGRLSLQVTDFDDFISRAVGSQARMDERNWDVAIEVDGDLANVWQQFNMFVDGTLSHCGTEVIHLFRFPEGWRILHISETLISTGCEARNRSRGREEP